MSNPKKSSNSPNRIKQLMLFASSQLLSIRSRLGFYKSKFYYLRLRLRNSGKSSKQIFSDYYHKNHWKNKETISGDGSTLLYTKHIRREIPLLLRRLNATSILDAPCGDFNWFKEVELRDIKYTGSDIVDEMIFRLNQVYGNSMRKFIVLDVVKDELPKVDIWMCRDLIFHLPANDVFRLIDNFIKSEIKYLLITSHASVDIVNEDAFLGGFRLINILRPPFLLPEPIDKIKDYIDGFPERYLMLYDRQALKQWREV